MARLARKLKRGERLEFSAAGISVFRDRNQVVVIVNTAVAKPEDIDAMKPPSVESKIDKSEIPP